MEKVINLNPTCTFVDLDLAGETISARLWGDPHTAATLFILIPGLGAACSWMEPLASRLRQRGAAAISFDMAGFGKREKDNPRTYTRWISETQELIRRLSYLYPSAKLYLLGNSMGALIALCAAAEMAAARNCIDGLILLAPGFEGCPRTFSLRYKIVTLVKGLLDLNRSIVLPYDIYSVSDDPAALQYLYEDCGGEKIKVEARLLIELLKLTNFVRTQVRKLLVPTLIVTAGQDCIVDNITCHKVFERLSCPKKLVHLSNAYHDLTLASEIDEVVEKVLSISELAEPEYDNDLTRSGEKKTSAPLS